jgi:nitroimidazol reductase NimA-like FMN-containing flavoprotein (pyridoxamine 5'-phosphate oxidase superfamily)
VDPELHELSREECLELLDAHHVGRVALLTGAAPVIVPVNYRLTGARGLTWIALRTRFGGVIERSSLEVAFEIDHVDDATRTGWSVLVRGTLHHLDPEGANFDAGFDSEPWLTDRDAWMIIQPYSIEGRKLTQPPGP